MHYACRFQNKACDIYEILKHCRTNEKEFSKCYKKTKNSLFSELDVRLKPADIVVKACNKLKLAPNIQKAA